MMWDFAPQLNDFVAALIIIAFYLVKKLMLVNAKAIIRLVQGTIIRTFFQKTTNSLGDRIPGTKEDKQIRTQKVGIIQGFLLMKLLMKPLMVDEQPALVL